MSPMKRLISNPGVVAVPVEQVDVDRELVLADVHRVARSALIIVEADDVEIDLQLLLNFGDVCNIHRVLNFIQPSPAELVVVVMGQVSMISMINEVDCREHRVPKAALVSVLHVDVALLKREEGWKLHICDASHHGIVLSDVRHGGHLEE